MLTAIRQSSEVLQASIKSLSLLEQPEAVSGMTFTPEESYPQIKVLADHVVLDLKGNKGQVVTLVNSLVHHRQELVSVLVNSPKVMVGGCNPSVQICQKSCPDLLIEIWSGEKNNRDKFIGGVCYIEPCTPIYSATSLIRASK